LREAMVAVAPGVPFSVWVSHGPPGDAILEVARKVGADLVVVGASHHGALGRAVLGTAAQWVVRGSPAPVLVLREPFLRPLRSVLLTTDLSELSARVHEAGLDLVDALFAGDAPEVRSLAVVTEGLVPPPLPRDTLLHEAEMQLEEFLAVRRPRVTPVRPAVRAGDPADEIAGAAVELDPDLLVMGTHARHGVQRLMLGSVAESVLDGAPCNVLVIPPLPAGAAAEAEPVMAFA
jgi:nucleotide-binding universal stress UspA family protein